MRPFLDPGLAGVGTRVERVFVIHVVVAGEHV
jgi:hypothetical protein